jgi:hypothetical protein
MKQYNRESKVNYRQALEKINNNNNNIDKGTAGVSAPTNELQLVHCRKRYKKASVLF